MDGGSVERWEDPDYREVYGKILKGDWEKFDAWNIGKSVVTPWSTWLYDLEGSWETDTGC